VWNPKEFDEREIPPMSAEMFSALVTARLRPLPEIEIEGGKGLALQLRVRGQATTAHLERAYERYRAAPEALTPVIDEFIRGLLGGETQAPSGTDEYARIAPNLFPRFMTAQQWSEKREANLRLVIRPLAQDLGVALVIDRGEEIEYVQLDAIPAWGVDAQLAYATAMENLERAAASIETVSHGEGVETLLIDHAADGYAAARALLPSRWRAWQARVQDELVLAIPTRDLLLGFARAHPALEELRAQVRRDAHTQPNGLFAELLVVRDNALEIFSQSSPQRF
jgi:uncharacterized protein YtpQ (UPF0354 family)